MSIYGWLMNECLEARACRQLWLSVITRAFADAFFSVRIWAQPDKLIPHHQRKIVRVSPYTLAESRQAAVWLVKKSKDFQIVCDNAGLNADKVSETFQKLMTRFDVRYRVEIYKPVRRYKPKRAAVNPIDFMECYT